MDAGGGRAARSDVSPEGPLALLETEKIEWHADLLAALAWSVGVLTLGGSSLLYLLYLVSSRRD